MDWREWGVGLERDAVEEGGCGCAIRPEKAEKNMRDREIWRDQIGDVAGFLPRTYLYSIKRVAWRKESIEKPSIPYQTAKSISVEGVENISVT